MKKVHRFRQICAKIIADRKEQGQESNDLLSSLIATQKAEDPKQRYTDEDIINEFVTFFAVGMDTTGHLIGMTFYNLHKYPVYLEDLKKEREAVYNKEPIVSADALQKMDVLHSILKETLRLYTPAPATFPRVAVEDHKLVDLSIRKGDLVRPDFMTNFFDEKNFKDPQQFDPSRWSSAEQKLDPYDFIPFSAGPRNCIGQHLAIIEAKVIISEFLNKFDFKMKDDYELKMVIRFLYEPVDEIKLQLLPKNL